MLQSGTTIPRLAAMLCLAAAANVLAQVPTDAPPEAARCIGCHNETGVTDRNHIPTIAGMGEFYLENQMIAFVEQKRPCKINFLLEHDPVDKCALLGSLSEEKQMAVAAYFASLEHQVFPQQIDPSLAEHGAQLHQAHCERCHTENGTEPLDDAAILAGQSIGYLIRQLHNFRAGTRWQPTIMSRRTKDLSERDIESLAHFYASVTY